MYQRLYDPLANDLELSAAVAPIPIIALLGLLAGLPRPAH